MLPCLTHSLFGEVLSTDAGGRDRQAKATQRRLRLPWTWGLPLCLTGDAGACGARDSLEHSPMLRHQRRWYSPRSWRLHTKASHAIWGKGMWTAMQSSPRKNVLCVPESTHVSVVP